MEATVGGTVSSALDQGLRGLSFQALTWKRRLRWAWGGYRAENMSQEKKESALLPPSFICQASGFRCFGCVASGLLLNLSELGSPPPPLWNANTNPQLSTVVRILCMEHLA